MPEYEVNEYYVELYVPFLVAGLEGLLAYQLGDTRAFMEAGRVYHRQAAHIKATIGADPRPVR